MARTLVLTFIAKDRPGLVDALSTAVAQAGGNWQDSRMAHLAEKFAGIARVEIPAAKVDELKGALTALEEEGFHLTVEEAAEPPPPSGPTLDLELVGQDHPGILREITHCLAECGASVEDMETDIRSAPMTGGTLFHARAQVRLSGRVDQAGLRGALEALANALMVDIDLR